MAHSSIRTNGGSATLPPPSAVPASDKKTPENTPPSPPLQRALNALTNRVFGLDVRSVALFRICLGVLLICDLLYRGYDLKAHYTEAGVMPLSMLAFDQAAHLHLSLHAMHGSPAIMTALFLLAGLVAFSLLLGYRTRTSAFVSWVLLISLQNRNPLILEGGDSVLRLMLFWAMFLPLNACWSLDRRLNKNAESVPDRFVSVGSAAWVVQVAALYWFSAILKSGVTWRSDNTAVFYALSIDQFATPLAKALLSHPQLLKMLTFLSWRLELLGPFLLLVSSFNAPLRTCVILAYIGFHLSLGRCLELGLFPTICACMWLSFLPGWFWQKALPFWSRLSKRLPSPAGRANTQKLLALSRYLHPERSGATSHWSAQCVAGFFLLYIMAWNVRTTDFNRHVSWFPTSWDWLGELTRVEQNWSLFAPDPMREHGWLVVPAKMNDGTEMDLLQEVSPVKWDPPGLISTTYINDRWRKYMLNICQEENKMYRLYYIQYLYRQWSQFYTGQRRIKSISLVYMRRFLRSDNQYSEWERVPLFSMEFQ